MGNSQATSSNPEFQAACRKFSASELEELKSLFLSLAAQSKSNGQFIIPSVFQRYYGLHGAIGARLFDLVTRKRNDHRLSFEDLVLTKSIYEKGSRQEIEEFLFQLIDVTGDGLVKRFELESIVHSLLETVLSLTDAGIGDGLPENSVQIFVSSLKPDESGCKHDEIITFEDFRQWCSRVPSLKQFLRSLLIPPRPGISGRHIPELLVSGNIPSGLLIMRREYAWHVAGSLQQEESQKWSLLYHSCVHGQSFNTFMGKMIIESGPSILVIKDKEGCIYGGYASQPWTRHSSFYGDMKSFLFSISPTAAIYQATGANSNVQWCAINFTAESTPNGLGFGGQVNHFGLFLSESFDQGRTLSSVTFKNPCLSKSSIFTPDIIECWGIVVGETDHDTNQKDEIKGTVLERFKEDRNMLNMMGIANSSD